MTGRFVFVSCLITIALPAVALAQDGQALYRAHCASCHEASAQTRAPSRGPCVNSHRNESWMRWRPRAVPCAYKGSLALQPSAVRWRFFFQENDSVQRSHWI